MESEVVAEELALNSNAIVIESAACFTLMPRAWKFDIGHLNLQSSTAAMTPMFDLEV